MKFSPTLRLPVGRQVNSVLSVANFDLRNQPVCRANGTGRRISSLKKKSSLAFSICPESSGWIALKIAASMGHNIGKSRISLLQKMLYG